MGKRNVLVISLMLSFGMSNAQKVIKKTILDQFSSHVLIDAQNCFKIELNTEASNELIVVAKLEGEYSNDLMVTIEDQGTTLKISAGFHPNFKHPNDKLSAHKVISIALEIKLPNMMDVDLFGTACNIEAKGYYNHLNMRLADGNCFLNGFAKHAKIDTTGGDIHVTSKGGTIVAESGFGRVTNEGIPIGDDYFQLSTVTGDIYLRKIE